MVEWLFNVWLSSRQTLYYDFPNRLRGDSNLSLLKCWYDHITHGPKCSMVSLCSFSGPFPVQSLSTSPVSRGGHLLILLHSCCTSLFPPFAWLSPAWGHASPLSLEALTFSSLTGHLAFLQSSVQGLLPNLPRQVTNLCCPFWQHQVYYLHNTHHRDSYACICTISWVSAFPKRSSVPQQQSLAWNQKTNKWEKPVWFILSLWFGRNIQAGWGMGQFYKGSFSLINKRKLWSLILTFLLEHKCFTVSH